MEKKRKIIVVSVLGIFIILIAIVSMGIILIMPNNVRAKVYAGEETSQAVNSSMLSNEEKELYNSAISRGQEELLDEKTVKTIIEEEIKRKDNEQQIIERENTYKTDMNYTCFLDDEAKIRFYYNRNLKISDSDNYSFYATSGSGIYSTSISYKFEKKDTKDFNLDKYVEENFTDTKASIQETTISKVNPITVKRVDILGMNRMDMTFYIFANKNGVATIGITNLLNPTIPENITEILDTIVVEDII